MNELCTENDGNEIFTMVLCSFVIRGHFFESQRFGGGESVSPVRRSRVRC
jgi:hypothetical protein